ncbi:hypothetical protein [Rhodococcus qingshengii]|uniref:hypothetical protein n=1 Tax=Rhodococcus qingshengii TaxID=334542 RepID=UPI00301ACA45
MSQSGTNPVLAPIRRWVLYSRTNLVMAVFGTVAFLFAVGALFGEDPLPPASAHETSTATEPVAQADSISYDLIEVSESLVAAKSATWVAANAPATAMAYAREFVNITASDAKWTSAIGRYTSTKPGEYVVAARPRTPVVITGPTVSTLSDGPDGARTAEVTVPTQAGDMRISLAVEEASGGKRWVVGSPLPTLDLSKVERIAPVTSTATPSTSPSTTRQTETTTPQPSSSSIPATSTPTPTRDLDEPAPTTADAPTPVPGPIPIPDLDTPIPGGL